MMMHMRRSTLRANKRWRVLVGSILVSAVCCLLPASTFSGEKWPGVDEAVVQKYAKDHGREAREPLINTDQGDLLLFAFLLAGTIGGFAAGYYWRVLISEKSPPAARRME
jgi:hypothetical protein